MTNVEKQQSEKNDENVNRRGHAQKEVYVISPKRVRGCISQLKTP